MLLTAVPSLQPLTSGLEMQMLSIRPVQLMLTLRGMLPHIATLFQIVFIV